MVVAGFTDEHRLVYRIRDGAVEVARPATTIDPAGIGPVRTGPAPLRERGRTRVRPAAPASTP
ncbi:hypothetical protein PL81_35540 [Streptomyces sp. RSD-27]|nr:hypothetical protein PL81_35540 [Streptomyces sp. RSD-27]